MGSYYSALLIVCFFFLGCDPGGRVLTETPPGVVTEARPRAPIVDPSERDTSECCTVRDEPDWYWDKR